jgi:hypothetical protein
MPITNINSSNTFSQFRQAFNEAANTINSLSADVVTNVGALSPLSSNGGATPFISLDSTYGDTQNPYAAKTANHVLAAPNGSSGVPSFRALVANDIPTLLNAIISTNVTANNLTSGRVALVGTSGLIQDDSGLTYNTTTDRLTVFGGIVTANVTSNNLTSGRVALVGADGLIQDDSGMTYDPTTDRLTVFGGIVTANVTSNNLTSGRVALVGTSGLIQDDSGMTYDPTTDVLTLSGTTDASNTTSGTLIVSGGVGIGKTLHVSGNTFISGNLIVLGSNTELSTTQINVNDSLIQLANNNTSDLIDIGVFGQYNSGAANLHSGLFRDASDGIWKLFKSYSTEPASTINPAANNFAYADLNVNTLTANSFVYLNNQNVLRFGSSVNANYVGLRSSSFVGSNVIWTLPNLDGSANQALITNGSGGLSFANAGISTGKSIAMAIIFGS